MEQSIFSYFSLQKNFQNFARSLFFICPKFYTSIYVENSCVVVVTTSFYFEKLVKVVKSHFGFQQIIDFNAIDRLVSSSRFKLTLILRNFQSYNSICAKTHFTLIISVLTEEMKKIPSISHIFKGNNWLEREVWDLFGIMISGHPDLRKILSDYGFNGFPLRKDFPLTGYLEIRYDDSLQRIVSEPVELTQAYRFFDFLSPWVKTDF